MESKLVPFFGHFIFKISSKINPNLKNSEFIGNNGLYIPTGAHLNKKIQTFIAETLINKVRSYT